jgi:hypothetical protein
LDGKYELTENYNGKGIFISDGTWQKIPHTSIIKLSEDNQFYEITKSGNLLRLDPQGYPIASEFDMRLKKK